VAQPGETGAYGSPDAALQVRGCACAAAASQGRASRHWAAAVRLPQVFVERFKDLVLRALAGEGTGLAGQIISAVDEMTPAQRVAAAEVIGQALAESDHLPDLKTQVIGELWLRDLELTARRVLHAAHKSPDAAGRDAFIEAWTSV
jgi:hypothetical protein